MPITLVQVATVGATNGPGLTVTSTFSSLPTPGNHIIAVAATNPEFATNPTGFTLADNQSGNTYSLEGIATGQANVTTVHSALVVGSTGTFTVTATVTPSGADTGKYLLIMEVAGLDDSNLVDILVQLSEQASYGTTFNVTTATPDTAEEFFIAVATPRNNGSFNSISPPTDYTELYEDLTGLGAGYVSYRITSVAAAQSINYSGLPIDGSPSMVVVSFRGGGAPPAGVSVAWFRA